MMFSDRLTEYGSEWSASDPTVGNDEGTLLNHDETPGVTNNSYNASQYHNIITVH